MAAANPVINTNRREEKTRDRVLSDAELRTVWRALEDDDYGTIVKTLILTGSAAMKLLACRWSEIDLTRGLIELPGERTKNSRRHDVPMAAAVRALLEARKKEAPRSVFGRGDGPFSGWSKAKEALNKRTGPLKHWTLHDLRRTTATGMAGIGIQPHIIEAVLNHVSGHKGGIAGIYNRAQYAAEKVQALAQWDEHVHAAMRNK